MVGGKMNKKGLLLLSNLFFVIVFFAYISNSRLIEIGNSLTINLTYFIYPLVYLFLGVIVNYFGNKTARDVIKATSITFITTILLIMIINLIPSNLDTVKYELLFKSVFTPNSIIFHNFTIFYPDLIFLGAYYFLFILTSYIMVAVFSAVLGETKNFIAFYLSMFISLILFTILLLSVDCLVINKLIFKDYIFVLTAGFIVTIALSIIILFINSIINLFKKSNQD